MKPLAIIPSFLRKSEDLEMLGEAIRSIRDTKADVDVLVVDDGSPAAELVDAIEGRTSDWRFELQRQKINEGFSRTVNVGLRRCLEEGRDAILVNADIEMMDGWLSAFHSTPKVEGREQGVIGALLVYPQLGLVQHGGIYFSLLTRSFDHLFKFAPMNLPELHKPRLCPVTGALQYIPHDTLTEVGIYDESFRMGFEDVDYCLRVFQAGRTCVFNPKVRAWHAESVFRGRADDKIAKWQEESLMRLWEKYQKLNLADFIPFL